MSDVSVEIERKFLVSDFETVRLLDAASFLDMGIPITQGYIASSAQGHSLRVRMKGHEAEMTLKGPRDGNVRFEHEEPISYEFGQLLLKLAHPNVVHKLRYSLDINGQIWTLDRFEGHNFGLMLAETELDSPDQVIGIPEWCGTEVTDDDRYYNEQLAAQPYSTWEHGTDSGSGEVAAAQPDEVPFESSARRMETLLKLIANRMADSRHYGENPNRVLESLIFRLQYDKSFHEELVGWLFKNPWLSERNILEDIGKYSDNPESTLSKLMDESQIVALPDGASPRYLSFQFDGRSGKLRPAAAKINQILGAKSDPWGVASWWYMHNERLNLQRPADILSGDSKQRDGQPCSTGAGAVKSYNDSDLIAIAEYLVDPDGGW